MAGVIFDSFAGADFHHHLDIVVGALLQALRLQQFSVIPEPLQPLFQLRFDGFGHQLHVIPVGDVMGRRENGNVVPHAGNLPGHRVHLFNGINFIAEHLHTDRLFAAGRIDIDNISPGSEGATVKIHIVSVVLHIHQFPNHVRPIHLHTRPQGQQLIPVGIRASQAVDAGHAGHHNGIRSLQQGRRSGVPKLIDFVVDIRILLDISIRGRHVRLRLIVIVVGDEVFHRVLRKKLLHLPVELRRQGFVVRNNQRWLLNLLDDLRHGERLSGTGDPHQGLVPIPGQNAVHNMIHRLGLIPGEVEIGMHFKFRHNIPPIFFSIYSRRPKSGSSSPTPPAWPSRPHRNS